MSLKDFRALTLERLVRFTEQRFFQTSDYMNGAELGAQEGICCYTQQNPPFQSHYALADPLRFQAGLEAATFVDYSLSIKAR